MPEDQGGESTPHLNQESPFPDLLAFIAIRISSRTRPTPEGDRRWEQEFLANEPDRATLVRPTDSLAMHILTELVPRIGIPLDVKVFARSGTIELGILIFGAYALLKDYKPLRDSLMQLGSDIEAFLGRPSLKVDILDLRTPGASVPEVSGSQVREAGGGLIGMGVASRYAFLWLLILNVLALIFFGYLTLTAVMANT
jgi:hypothetical protein